jgi:methylenetetrahydrofolate dehydrogenase (NADP+)/methenyltetrahydrofolate cyclohydrolase/formyltetrahydrofolate synthetase
VAAGHKGLIKSDWVSPGCVAIDVGINFDKDSETSKGMIYGDIDIDEEILEKVDKITPVPGGVGPMTIAMLMQNIVTSWQRSDGSYHL